MYTLRKISQKGYETNIFLGERYDVVGKKQSSEEFEHILAEFYKNESDIANLYMFVAGNKGETIPLYKDEFNYIVTDGGKTFSNLTY